ncbi:UNVERIFIED_CONTAM: hypothetical protein RMT77_008553 [Armadillidium vulgare]
MGILENLNNYWVISANRNIFLLNKSTSDVTKLEVPLSKDHKNTKKNDDSSDDIVLITISKDQRYCAVATLSKRLLIWEISSSWSLLIEESLTRKPMAFAFAPDSSAIVVADKTGDVYLYPISGTDKVLKGITSYAQDSNIDVEPGPEPLLGHLSMLLDLVLTDDGKYLITCDRDEKIRVSSYPNCYNIHTFCLGHTEFVSHIKLLQESQTTHLLSASGDGKVILWNYLTGENLCILNLKEMLESYYQSSCLSVDQVKNILSSTYINILEITPITSKNYLLVISFHRVPLLLVYELDPCREQFTYLFSYDTNYPLIDAKFIESKKLVVFVDISEEDRNSLIVLRFTENNDNAYSLDDHFISKFGEEYKEKLKTKNVWSMDASALFKHNKYDNVAEYLKKKQERVNSCRNKPEKRKSPEI